MSWTMLPLKNLRSPLSSALRTSMRTVATRGPTLSEDMDLLTDLGVDDMPPSPPYDTFKPTNPLRENTRKPKSAVPQPPPVYYLFVQSSRNNTIVNFTRPNGGTLKMWSGGSCGFKKGNRSGYEAGYQCAVRAFARIAEEAKMQPIKLGLRFKGFGQGREALFKALMTTEGDAVRPMVVEVEDRTPIKIGGTRSKKMRRL